MRKKWMALCSAIACCAFALGMTACEKILHRHDYQPTVTAPTCTEKGYTTYRCSCGEEYVDSYVSALDHNFVNYLSNENATCEEDATETAVCENEGCEETDTRAKENSALGHSYTNYVSDNNATYTKDGTKTAVCDNDGCESTDTIVDEGTKKIATGKIGFKNLTVQEGNTVYGKTDNATDSFSFVNEIECIDGAQFTVALDRYGLEVAFSKVVPLKVGDNVFYVFETLNGEIINTYKVTIRRRPIYTVTFDMNGGEAVETQKVEEDGFAVAPTPIKTGYTFVGWDYDFINPITQNQTVTASWTANENTPYTVKHYLQNAENDEYTLADTDNETGTTGETVFAIVKTYAHYIPTKTEISGVVAPDGSLELKLYYNLETFTVTFQGNGGTITSGAKQAVKYGNAAVEPTVSYPGYKFIQWDKSFTAITENLTVTASWEIIVYSVSYNANGGELATGANPSTYTVETSTAIVNPTREYYEFLGWYDGTRKITTFLGVTGDLNLTAKWEYVFLSSGSTLTGMTEYGKNTYTTVVLPSVINGVTITEIGVSAFENYAALQTLTIPETIEYIYDRAFMNCTALETLYYDAVNCADIGWEYNYIFDLAGRYGAGVDVIVGNKVKSIPSHLFVPYRWSEYEDHVPNVKTLTFEQGSVCERIGDSAFAYCYPLQKITFPDSLKQIGQAAFRDCDGLKTLILPNSLTTLGSGAFLCCDILEEVQLSDGLKTISSQAFSSCVKLKKLSLGKNITTIEPSALTDLSALEELYFNAPNLVSTDSDNLFYKAGWGGNGIAVTIGKDVTKICDYLFCPDDNVVGIYPKITSVVFEEGGACTAIGRFAFYNCSSLTSIQLPDTITYIGGCAFGKCKALKELTLPNGLTYVGASAFIQCTFTYNEYENGYYLGSSNNPYLMLMSPKSTDVTSMKIHEDTKIIYSTSFSNCSNLKSITIPASVSHIVAHTFYNKNFTSITFEITEGWYFNTKNGDIPADVTASDILTNLSKTYYDSPLRRDV